MGNEENLKKGEAFRFRSGEEAARAGSIGGRKSAQVRKKRKAMKTALSELLTLPPDSEEAQAALAGIVGLDDADNQTAVLAGLMKAAMGGDVKAVQELRNILGESRDTAAEAKERKARVEKLQTETEYRRRSMAGTQEPEKESNLLDRLSAIPDEDTDELHEIQ